MHGKPGSLTCPVQITNTRKHFSWEEPVHISFFSNFSWSEGESNSQSVGRQSSVLPLSQILSLSLPIQPNNIMYHADTLFELDMPQLGYSNLYLQKKHNIFILCVGVVKAKFKDMYKVQWGTCDSSICDARHDVCGYPAVERYILGRGSSINPSQITCR